MDGPCEKRTAKSGGGIGVCSMYVCRQSSSRLDCNRRRKGGEVNRRAPHRRGVIGSLGITTALS